MERNNEIKCPSCDASLESRLDIKLKTLLPVDVAIARRERHADTSAKEEPYVTTARTCPHCRVAIQLQLEIKIIGVQVLPSHIAPAEDSQQVKGTRMAQEYYISQLREDGVVKAFEEALSVANAESMPNDIVGALLAYLNGATQIEKVPRFVLHEFAREFPRHFVTFWQYNGIVGVKAGRELRWFVPAYYINGRNSNTKGKGGGLRLRTEPRPAQVQEWVKTRNGYVVGRGALHAELSGKRAGHFAKATGNY